MASGSITSWQIDGETMADFIFLGSRITLIQKPDKDITQKENYRPVSLMNSRKTPTFASLTTLKPLPVWITKKL